MSAPEKSAVAQSFPDFTLTISYAQGLLYAQLRLRLFAHGGIRRFCQEHQLPYTTIINLKNDRLPEQQPLLLQRLLRSLDIVAEPLRQGKDQYFLLPSKEALTTFEQQLISLQSKSPPT